MWEYTESADPEAVEPCPYERSHMIRRKRMQYHLMKCRKNHPGKDFATCPFNACHEMRRPELRYHIATCPDKAVIEKDLVYEQEKEMGEGVMFKGCTDVPAYNSYEVTCSESWDDEVNPNPRIGVDESYLDKVKFKNITGMTPSEKRYFHRTLNPEHNPPAPVVQTDSRPADKENQQPTGQGDSKLRLPKNAPKAFSMYQEQQPLPKPQQTPSAVFAYSLAQCGIGRGRGVGMSLGRGISSTRPGVPQPGILPNASQVSPGNIQPGPPHPSAVRNQLLQNYYASLPSQPGLQNPVQIVNKTPSAPVLNTNHAYQDQKTVTVTPDSSDNLNMTDYPNEAIPASNNLISQSQTYPSLTPSSDQRRKVQAPPGIFPDQIPTRPIGRGRGLKSAPIDPWPTLNGSSNTNCNQNGHIFNPGVGSGWVPESDGSSSGSESLRDVHGIEGAKKRKQLQKKLRQIESLEAKMKAGTPLNTEEEVKLCKKDDLLEELQALSIGN